MPSQNVKHDVKMKLLKMRNFEPFLMLFVTFPFERNLQQVLTFHQMVPFSALEDENLTGSENEARHGLGP